MVDEQSSAAAGQQSLYPSPPPFYKLYREDADGTAERPLPPVPPAPVTGDYQMFGEIHTVGLRSELEGTRRDNLVRSGEGVLQIEPGNPPLQGVPLVATQRNQTISAFQICQCSCLHECVYLAMMPWTDCSKMLLQYSG